MTVAAEQREAIRRGLCELPAARRERFQAVRGLSPYDATVIVDRGRAVADYFERVADVCGDSKQAANWVAQDVLRELHDRHCSIEEFPITADVLAAILARNDSSAITVKSGRELFGELLRRHDEEDSPPEVNIDMLIDERGLRLVSDGGELDAAIESAVAGSPQAVADFRAGKQQALGAIIGKIMRDVRGADAKAVRERLIARLQQ
ncbi:MAG: hypothetical protein WD176_10785 [Pirellulales bacterium]